MITYSFWVVAKLSAVMQQNGNSASYKMYLHFINKIHDKNTTPILYS